MGDERENKIRQNKWAPETSPQSEISNLYPSFQISSLSTPESPPATFLRLGVLKILWLPIQKFREL